VRSTSYCGFASSSRNLGVSFVFSDSGRGRLKYGNSWKSGYVNVYMNKVKIGSVKDRRSSTITFEYSTGDVLLVKEINAIITIDSLGL
jgi:hypothetical protein